MGSAGASDSITVKVTHCGQTKRATFSRAELTYERLCEWMTAAFGFPGPLNHAPQPGCSVPRLAYRDPEGDVVSIGSNDELEEALRLKQEDAPLILQLSFPRVRERWHRHGMNAGGNFEGDQVGAWGNVPNITPQVTVDGPSATEANESGSQDQDVSATDQAEKDSANADRNVGGAESSGPAPGNVVDDAFERRRARMSWRLAQMEARRNGLPFEPMALHPPWGPRESGPRYGPFNGPFNGHFNGPFNGPFNGHHHGHHHPHGHQNPSGTGVEGQNFPHPSSSAHPRGPEQQPCFRPAWRQQQQQPYAHAYAPALPPWAAPGPWTQFYPNPYPFSPAAPPMMGHFAAGPTFAHMAPMPSSSAASGFVVPPPTESGSGSAESISSSAAAAAPMVGRRAFLGHRNGKECEDYRTTRMLNIALFVSVLIVILSFAPISRIFVPVFGAAVAIMVCAARRSHNKSMKWRHRAAAAAAHQHHQQQHACPAFQQQPSAYAPAFQRQQPTTSAAAAAPAYAPVAVAPSAPSASSASIPASSPSAPNVNNANNIVPPPRASSVTVESAPSLGQQQPSSSTEEYGWPRRCRRERHAQHQFGSEQQSSEATNETTGPTPEPGRHHHRHHDWSKRWH